MDVTVYWYLDLINTIQQENLMTDELAALVENLKQQLEQARRDHNEELAYELAEQLSYIEDANYDR